ncbi:MAG: aldehyde dehydrogenase family protein [Phycisphaerae bacterium]
MMQSGIHAVLIGGRWRESERVGEFRAVNPATRGELGETYPVSGWGDLEGALAAASAAAGVMRGMGGEQIASFLEGYAGAIEEDVERLAGVAAEETGLAVKPRLAEVELPRTVNQLRQAGAAAREGSWRKATIDTKIPLRSGLAPLGAVWTIGPNNFPFAYNGVAGGDFASAIAAGNPVIAKGHPLHPTTTRLLAEHAHQAAMAAGLPTGAVQMIYHVEAEVGLKFVADGRLKAIGFTGSRAGGLALKAAADRAGKLFFGEMSSLNPVVILPGAIAENANGVADQLVTSVTVGAGQFCTKPGLVFLVKSGGTEGFVGVVRAKLAAAAAGVLFSGAGQANVLKAVEALKAAGAELVLGGAGNEAGGFGISNTLLRTTAAKFLGDPQTFQTEAFGNATLMVVAENVEEMLRALERLEGNLTGSVYSASGGSEESAYAATAGILRPRVGRLLNDKMPTGVAVSSAMNHGGPFPATTQPHFTAVGFPAAIGRFTQLESYDNVRSARLPVWLRDKNPTGRMWRMIDGQWTTGDVTR